MNVLDTDKRAQILNCLVEGCSMRSATRLTGAAKKTVERLLVSAGEACAEYMDKAMRNLPCKLLQVDEVWSFTYAKQKNVPAHMRNDDEVGDTWTWVVLDSETKLVPCWRVGKRDGVDAWHLMKDLSGRLTNRVQLTSDGHTAYLQAVENVFEGEIDYAMLVKLYGQPSGTNGRKTEARHMPPGGV